MTTVGAFGSYSERSQILVCKCGHYKAVHGKTSGWPTGCIPGCACLAFGMAESQPDIKEIERNYSTAYWLAMDSMR